MQDVLSSQDQQPVSSPNEKQTAPVQAGGMMGIMGPRKIYNPNTTNDVSDMAVRLMQKHGEISPEEREQQEAEARIKKEMEEAKQREIDSYAEKPWEWMRDHAVEHREGDFLVAIASRAEHLEVIRAGRKWRQVSAHAHLPSVLGCNLSNALAI